MLQDERLIRGTPKRAVFLFHGYGDTGQGMHGLAQELAHGLPEEIAFFCPHAPEPATMWPDGKMWFDLPIGDIAPGDLSFFLDQKKRLMEIVPPYVKAVQDEFSLPHRDIVFGGFSQGGLVSMLMGAFFQPEAAGVLSLSGVPMVDPEAVQMPPVLLVHGLWDTTVPVPLYEAQKAFLTRQGIDFEFMDVPQMGHEVTLAAATRAREFIRKVLA